MTSAQLSVAFFLQMFAILMACRLVGALARRVGQPQVVGEMVAGILLGPSLFGLLAPTLQRTLFPQDSLAVLHVVAQLGVALYMFLVGVEFRTDLFRQRIRSAAAVSASGIVAPFVLGSLLALWLVEVPGLFAPRVTRLEAMLFIGAAMAITAFPMLARIIDERGLAGTPLGTLALAAGSMDDAAAWCILAIVLASFGGGPAVALFAIVGGAAYTLVVLTVGRRVLARLEPAVERAGGFTPPLLAAVLTLLMLAAWIADAVGIHAVFGGFLLGVAMPRGRVTRELRRQLEPLAVVFLLPTFFTFSGLNTRFDIVTTVPLVLMAGAILLVACLGKGVACWAAACWKGEDRRSGMAIGALMNARGMMELIALNIGLQQGIILPPLFSIMVFMAVATTLLASPVFELVYGRHARRTGALGMLPEGAAAPRLARVPEASSGVEREP